jgi:hypothetical protein
MLTLLRCALIACLCATFSSMSTIAQTPNLINYQAVARNAAGAPLANQAIAVRLSVRQSTAAGTIQYQERHAVTTNAQGLFNVQIGAGTVLSGTFAAITWSDAQQKHLQIELDPAGGTTYTNMGTQQLVSVPYALYAKEAATATNDNDTNPTNEIQILSIAGNTVSLSNGGGNITLPSNSGNAWNILGNSGTNPATNFIGTTDNQPLQFRVNNLPAGHISDTNAAIGTGALQNNTSGSLNTAMGTSALAANTRATKTRALVALHLPVTQQVMAILPMAAMLC